MKSLRPKPPLRAFQPECGRCQRVEFSIDGCGTAKDHPRIQRQDTTQYTLGDVSGLSRDAIEALPAAVYMTDAEGRLTFYNKARPSRFKVARRAE